MILVIDIVLSIQGTVLIRSFLLQTTLRVWDTFLYEGNKVSSIAYLVFLVRFVLFFI